VILVDNASTDGGPKWVEQHYPQVRLLSNSRNLGYAAACNQGASVAAGDVLVFLNQDTRVQPGWLEALLNGLLSFERAGLVTSRLLLMSQPERINLCGQDLHYTGISSGRGALQPASAFPDPQPVAAVSGASFAIRAALWRQLGGFDPSFFMYYEETDLSFRAALLGYASWYAPDSLVCHDAALNPSPNAIYYTARNRLILLLRHWKAPTLLIISPALLLAGLVEWVYRFRLGLPCFAAGLRADFWLLAHPLHLWRLRRAAQSGRQVSDWLLLQRCTPRLSPAVMPLGQTGQRIVGLANILFELNYRIALSLTRWLRL
jgi:hypothetical protein